MICVQSNDAAANSATLRRLKQDSKEMNIQLDFEFCQSHTSKNLLTFHKMFNLKHPKTSPLDNQQYKKFVNESVIDLIQNLENISPISKPQTKMAQVKDVKKKLFSEDVESNKEVKSMKKSKSRCFEKIFVPLVLVLGIVAIIFNGLSLVERIQEEKEFEDALKNQFSVRVMVDLYGDYNDKDKYIGLEESNHSTEDQGYGKISDIMEIIKKYEDDCDKTFAYGSRFYISNSCFFRLLDRNSIIDADLSNSKNTAYLQI